jgi:hypothetical protein
LAQSLAIFASIGPASVARLRMNILGQWAVQSWRGLICAALCIAMAAACGEASQPGDGAAATGNGFDLPLLDTAADAPDTTLDADAVGAPDTTLDADAADAPDTTLDADTADAPDTTLDADAADAPDTTLDADATGAPDTTLDADAAGAPDTTLDADAADAGGAFCVDMAKPAPVAAELLATQVGSVETVKAGEFTDDFLVQADGQLKVGVRREWGASIVFFGFHQGPGMNKTNAIDANDTGREVQVALYDPARAMQGCAWNASCQQVPTTCANSITYLGWNPVQGGNECNAGSPIEGISGDNGVLKAVVRPNHWNPDWQEPQCANNGCNDPAKKTLLSDVRYTQRLRFIQNNVVEIDMQVDNLSDMAHAATLQEFPTLYAAFGANGTPNLNVLLDSSGQQVVIDQPANDGFFVKAFSSPGGWATLQNQTKDYGVALYYENRLASFQGWQKAGVFNNFRSQFSFGIPAKATVRARAYLVLGGFATVKALIEGLDAKIPAFGSLDSPTAEQPWATSVHLNGWVLDNYAVAKVEARLDGQPWAQLPLDVARPDVCAAWPGYAMCQGPVGFDKTVALPAGLGACGHLVELVATDSHGNSRLLGSQRIFTGGAKPPVVQPPAAPAQHPVWRFTATTPGVTDHMFGLTQQAPGGYASEGKGFDLFDGPSSAAQPLQALYQRYCADCTDHMPSLDANEGSPTYTGADLLGYCASQPSEWAKTKLTRLYSAKGSDHFLTASDAEVQAAAAVGYVAEWSCWGP